MTCPKCSGLLDVEEDDLDEGDTLSCDECGSDLKVVSTGPIELEAAADAEEVEEEFDGDDEDEFEEEDEEEDEWS
jgi:alpha-aminoadipate/glutamate carrier protein LysW